MGIISHYTRNFVISELTFATMELTFPTTFVISSRAADTSSVAAALPAFFVWAGWPNAFPVNTVAMMVILVRSSFIAFLSQGHPFADILEQVLDIDPDDQFVLLVFLVLNLLFDDTEDCCVIMII